MNNDAKVICDLPESLAGAIDDLVGLQKAGGITKKTATTSSWEDVRAAAEDLLNAYANEVVAEGGGNFYDAYDAVLKTPRGRLAKDIHDEAFNAATGEPTTADVYKMVAKVRRRYSELK